MSIKKDTALEVDELISVKRISKEFSIGDNSIKKLKNLLRGRESSYEIISALNDISFKVRKGEAVGIIGKNGSGKSTLLQIVCGTLSQTKGIVNIRGKMAALLELGSGFNPEFTGRENIIINGLLMGLSKKQINIRINEIIKFAEIGIFIDQPLRTYSSGMVVRLAFSVIAHVDADILIIDEALAVGDSYFTQKCMRFIRRFKENGAILFVSHDMNAVQSLCDKAILLEGGNLIYHGKTKETIEMYTRMQHMSMISGKDRNIENEYAYEIENKNKMKYELEILDEYRKKWTDALVSRIDNRGDSELKIHRMNNSELNSEDYGNGEATIKSARIKNLIPGKNDGNIISGGELVEISIEWQSNRNINSFICGFILKNEMGLTLLGDNTANKIGENNISMEGEILKVDFAFTMPLCQQESIQ